MNTEPTTVKVIGEITNALDGVTTIYLNCGHYTVTNDATVVSINGHMMVLQEPLDHPSARMAAQRFADLLSDVTA